jgi:micrococcal nuclease
MDRGARIFWTIVLVLTAASFYFGVRAESVRRSVQHAQAAVQNGDLVSFKQVLDADTVLLANGEGDPVTVRVIGIKSFDLAKHDSTGDIARRANDAMKRALEGKPIRIMLGTPPKDKSGRTLATLFVDDQDVGEQLIREGLVLVYTPFPFPTMTEYLHEQAKARGERKGLWGDPIAVERADALLAEWRKGAP